mmetsp:Transcript_25789/g.54272  ORF Transcript_25789/g.54272 Transcript_25789/m.54272 type:complete len:218 (+) Transcript_25789:1047-1700(+)
METRPLGDDTARSDRVRLREDDASGRRRRRSSRRRRCLRRTWACVLDWRCRMDFEIVRLPFSLPVWIGIWSPPFCIFLRTSFWSVVRPVVEKVADAVGGAWISTWTFYRYRYRRDRDRRRHPPSSLERIPWKPPLGRIARRVDSRTPYPSRRRFWIWPPMPPNQPRRFLPRRWDRRAGMDECCGCIWRWRGRRFRRRVLGGGRSGGRWRRGCRCIRR